MFNFSKKMENQNLRFLNLQGANFFMRTIELVINDYILINIDVHSIHIF